ncbi:MAG: hypothetical protein KatS3mg036_0979 [Ignavibacterium sp.]|nr:MAG: hypothetical protein KatS3mg036_0979 [Ignavibacterium sp.]
MANQNLYNTLEIPGSFLVPGFSIYVLEIVKEKQKWFYIGMTGDPHYPSARAAFHRISGHLELSNRSTQNQLRIALKEKLGIVTGDDLRKITIKMHHYPIEGFTRITGKQLNNETVQQLKLTPEYKEYKKIQQQVLALENALIFDLKDKLLNKTKGKSIKQKLIPYPEIYKSIIELVNNG